jgi:N utilization substance protein B
MPDVPIKVVLNEALELAKTFSTGGSSSFINGILDRYVRELQNEPGSG